MDAEKKIQAPVTPGERFRARLIVSVLLIVFSLVVGGGVFQFLALKRPAIEPRPVNEKTYNVGVFRAEVCTLQEILSGFGTARADREVVISAPVTGEVVEINPQLKVGTSLVAPSMGTTEDGKSKPQEGDLLIRIDPRAYQERVTQAKSRLEEVNADINSLRQQIVNNERLLKKSEQDYKNFESEYERIKRSNEKKVASDSEVTRALLELNRYQDNVLRYQSEAKLLPLQITSAEQKQKTLENDLEIARLNLTKTQLHVPFDGRISEVMVELGQFLAVGSGIARLTDSSLVEIPIPLAISDFSKIENAVLSGQQPLVQIAENESAEPKWDGRVVRASPEADERTRTVQVFVQVDNRDTESPLLPGTFVNARIVGPVLKGVYAVPRDAILNKALFVVRDGRAVKLNPKVQRVIRSLAIVEADLQPNDQVILTNLDIIFDGAKIEIQKERTIDEELATTRAGVKRLDATAESKPRVSAE